MVPIPYKNKQMDMLYEDPLQNREEFQGQSSIDLLYKYEKELLELLSGIDLKSDKILDTLLSELSDQHEDSYLMETVQER